jgi:hypothetical protein
VPAQLEGQLSVLLTTWHMAKIAVPLSDSIDRPIQAIFGCFPLDHAEPAP